MTDELIDVEDISVEKLHDLMESAYIDSHANGDGLVVVDTLRFLLMPFPSRKCVRLVSVFSFKPEATLADRLFFANKINSQMVALRAGIAEETPDSLMLDWTVSISGGVTRRYIINSVRLFGDMITAAMREDTGNIIA